MGPQKTAYSLFAATARTGGTVKNAFTQYYFFKSVIGRFNPPTNSVVLASKLCSLAQVCII